MQQVSVICTAKNAAATIGWTIASILAQRMTDWEMVVVDDGSSDDTAAIVAAIAERDSRVRLVRTAGVGRVQALNIALAEARAPLVANTDADDESHPDRLGREVECLRRHPEFALVCSDEIRIWGDQRPDWWAPPPPTSSVVEITNQLAVNNPIGHSTVIMRRATVLEVGGYRHPLIDDYDLWVRLVEAGHRIGRIPYPLVARRIHSGHWFLTSPRFRYLAEGAKIQARAIRARGMGGYHCWALLALRVAFGFLPLNLRLRWWHSWQQHHWRTRSGSSGN